MPTPTIAGSVEDLERRLTAAGVPPRFVGCSFDTYAPRQGAQRALQAAREVAAAARAGLVLCGPPGTGKTHLAAALLRERLARWLEAWPSEHIERMSPDGYAFVVRRPDLRVRLVSVPMLLDRLRMLARFADGEDPLPGLTDADLVVLDDLGREKVTDWASERLYVLVNERYSHMRPTVVTSNYRLDELADRGYDAIISRLVEGAPAVQITASDYRSAVR